MSTRTLRLWWWAVALAWLSAGCGPSEPRCAKCGMLVADHPRWVAGATSVSGTAEEFCCPRCLFAWQASPRGAGSREHWITEYYTQERRPVTNVLFVAGSDVVGPMGKSLVPVAGMNAAERFRQDHKGHRVLQPNEITPELLRELGGKPTVPGGP